MTRVTSGTEQTPSKEQGPIGGRWELMNGDRQQHLERCRMCAEITIPSLLPKKEHDSSNDTLPIPYQALGARAVNNLAAKLLLTLFPPNTSFFRLDPDPKSVEELKQELGEEDFKQQIEKQLRLFERMSTQDFEALAMRAKMFQVLRHLVVVGNILLEIKDNGQLKTYRLDKYVVRRSPDGKLREAIIRELISKDDVPKDVLQNPAAKMETAGTDATTKNTLPMYTQIKLGKDGRWVVMQEVCGLTVPGSVSTYPAEKLPFLALTWALNDSEHYARGHVEENLGDLVAFDSLRQSLLEGASAAAFMINLVNPNSSLNIKDLKKARNGSYLEGKEGDIYTHTMDKARDFRTAFEEAQTLKDSIGRSFLLTESVQRDAERVTAEEIRMIAQELETSLGGIYSVLGVEFQKKFCKLLLFNQTKRKKLPPVSGCVKMPQLWRFKNVV